MKKLVEAKVLSNVQVTPEVKKIELKAPEIAVSATPGQFVTVLTSEQAAPLLRRPFGIADVNAQQGSITLVYRLLGEATHILAQKEVGQSVEVMGPLGHGFEITAKHPLLVGGGMGLAPLHFLASSWPKENVEVLMGGRTKDELFWTELYLDRAAAVHLTTDDGTAGTQGTVIAKLPELLASGRYDGVFVCGPVPMMKAVVSEVEKTNIPCQVSLEKYMACGLGACLSCSCGGIGKRLKVCTDGPVFKAQEVVEW